MAGTLDVTNNVICGTVTSLSPFVIAEPDCNCPCKYDPQCDGTISDVLDVSLTINREFRGAAIVQDPGCPVERTGVDASTATDVIDVTKVINVAFRGMPVASQYGDPCAP